MASGEIGRKRKMDWVIHPLFQYGLFSVTVGVCLYLFVTTRKEQSLDAKVTRAEVARLRSSLEVMRIQIGQLERRLCVTGGAPRRNLPRQQCQHRG